MSKKKSRLWLWSIIAILVMGLIGLGAGVVAWKIKSRDNVVEEPLETFRIMFVPGENLEQVKQRLLNAGYDATEIDVGLSGEGIEHAVLNDKPAEADLEGYIFPDTYEFYEGTSVTKILLTVLDHMGEYIDQQRLLEGFSARGFNLYQGIILASIIEREVPGEEDRRVVSQVFQKRLAEGMKLQSCTTQGLGPGMDTYEMEGLPKAPIANPGKTALYAVAHPTDTDYLYFVSGDDDADGNSVTHFARTNEEHEENIQRYCQVKCAAGTGV